MSFAVSLVGEVRVCWKQGVTGADTVTIPALHRLVSIDIHETAGHAVTGGIKIGTTLGGTDVVAAHAVGSNSFSSVTDSALLKRFFGESYGSDQVLNIDAVTGWNSASLNMYFTCQRIAP